MHGTGGGHKVLHPVGAGQRAAHPAPVITLVKERPVDLHAHVGGLGMLAVSEVVGGQKIVVVHDGHEMGSADHGHLVLFGVLFHDLLGVEFGHLLKGLFIRGVVHRQGHRIPAGHNGFQALVRKYGPETSTARLFEPGP